MGVAQVVRQNALTWGLVDNPNSRSSHRTPTPRGGGLGIVVAFEIATLICAARGRLVPEMTWALMLGGGLVATVGFMDDRRSLPAGIRLAVHLSVAIAIAVLLSLPAWPSHHISAIIFAALTVFLLAWGTNCFNFMDGIDGIAALQAAFMAGAAALLNQRFSGPDAATFILASLAAASVGFLALNWPPAKIFMGDGASGFLGFTFSLFAVAPLASPRISVPVWLLLGGLFIGDASVTLLRRILRGERFFQAHRLHAYQHLARQWKSHLPVTAAYGAVNMIWLLPWAYLVASAPQSAVWALPAALIPLTALLLAVGAGRQEDPMAS